VFGALLVPANAWLAERWLGREARVPAAWLTAAAPFLVWYGQEARNYSLLMVCVAVSGALLLGMRDRIDPGRLAAYALASLAGLLSNLSFAFLVPLHLAWWLGAKGRRRRRLALAGGLALVLVLALIPWLGSIRATWDWQRLNPGRAAEPHEGELRPGSTFHAVAIPWAFQAFAGGYTLGPSLRALRADHSLAALAPFAPELAAAVVVFGALSLAGLVALRRRGRLTEGLVLGVLAPVAFASYFALQNFKVFHPRYLAVVMPGLIAVWAAGWTDLRGWKRPAIVIGVAALWGLSLYRLYFDPRYEKDDLRSAARVLREQGRPGEVVVAASTSEMLFYYYRGPLPVRHYWLGFAADPARMASRFEAMRGGAGTWVVSARPEDLDPRGAFARWLDGTYPDADRFAFPGVRLWHLKGAPGAAMEPDRTP
jgi:4-amino-4-deoxy-L-arabinose transferase-like glycosyltransferase